MTKAGHHDQFADPLFAIDAAGVARALTISESTLGILIEEGRIPRGFTIPGHPRLVRWDPKDVQNLVREWKELANLGAEEGFGDVR